jgi:cytochrome c551/c552
LALFLLLGIPFPLEAQDKLISGPGSTLTENKCKICHELQHIRRSPLSRGEWADNLKNMKERGTPMSEAEMALILDYLAVYYSREKPAPEPSPDTLAAGGDPLQRLLDANACSGCHAPDKRVVGPSFKEIAARYAADPAAPGRLAQKVRRGGQGVWGSVPMPPNPGLQDADLEVLIGWILGRR